MINVTLPQRGADDWGSGAFGASRGRRTHKGIDYACYPGTIVKSPVAGLVTRIGYPYGDDLSYRYVEVTTPDGMRHRIFYIEPLVNHGDIIRHGSPIGEAQDIASRYEDPAKRPMTNHIHFEILDGDTPINPDEYFG